jgi:sialic acid synthase SpsE|tara:strand:- start:911 stop:1639 length:729 start_codon:yes stop_codon:yes gene_type:complete
MIIAEIGLNHLGYIELVNDYLDICLHADVDGITFQIREEEFYKNNSNLILSDSEYKKIAKTIQSKNKKFGVAIADINKIDFLESIDTDFYKVIRNDITNKNLMKKLISTGKQIIVSTGLSTDKDIKNFINEFGTKNITLNHTQLSYDVNDCNLLAIQTMREKYDCNISFGSHCDNLNVLYMSLCYNPSSILFYVKADSFGIEFPDDKHAIFTKNIKTVVKNLKSLRTAVGSGIKQKIKNKIG